METKGKTYHQGGCIGFVQFNNLYQAAKQTVWQVVSAIQDRVLSLCKQPLLGKLPYFISHSSRFPIAHPRPQTSRFKGSVSVRWRLFAALPFLLIASVSQAKTTVVGNIPDEFTVNPTNAATNDEHTRIEAKQVNMRNYKQFIAQLERDLPVGTSFQDVESYLSENQIHYGYSSWDGSIQFMLKKIYSALLVFNTDLQVKIYASEEAGVSEIKHRLFHTAF